MKLRMITLFDKKTKIHHPPFFAHNRADAIRSIENNLSKEGTLFNKYPDDYQVYDTGEFDDTSGQVQGQQLDFICELSDIIGATKEPKHVENN